MGEAFEPPSGVADNGPGGPTDGLHQPLASSIAVGTGEMTVKVQ